MNPPSLYDGPLDTPTVLAWILLGVTALLLAARAVRVEQRAARTLRAGAGGRITGTARALDVALDVAVGLAVLGLLAALAAVVLAVFG